MAPTNPVLAQASPQIPPSEQPQHRCKSLSYFGCRPPKWGPGAEKWSSRGRRVAQGLGPEILLHALGAQGSQRVQEEVGDGGVIHPISSFSTPMYLTPKQVCLEQKAPSGTCPGGTLQTASEGTRGPCRILSPCAWGFLPGLPCFLGTHLSP